MRRILMITGLLALLLTAVAVVPVSASRQDQQQFIVHIVQRGETLSVIARFYGTSAQAIANANALPNINHIFAGQRLVIPVGQVTPPTHPGTTYVVRQGDTLIIIGRLFGISPFAIAEANGIFNLNHVFAGQVLRIPTSGYVPPQPPMHPQPCSSVVAYHVVHGDTLARIAARFGTTTGAILACNSIPNPNRIFAGQVLLIPHR